MARNSRQSKILELISMREIETQEELCTELNNMNYVVTQATISRDIREMKLTKIADGNGKQKYAMLQNTSVDVMKKYRYKRNQKLIDNIRKEGFDILVTHAPAKGINDGEDLPHQGFEVFKTLMKEYRPKYFLHGHMHKQYGRNHKNCDQYEETQIINAFERYTFGWGQQNAPS